MIKLNFLGIGSGLNKDYGNTSSYFVDGDTFILIDCGNDVFYKLLDNEDFCNAGRYYVIVTHFHTDHIGSIGSLLPYLKCRKKPVTVYYPLKEDILSLFDVLGIGESLCSFAYGEALKINGHITVKPAEVAHDPLLHCFSYVLSDEDGRIFYSGDCAELPSDIITEINSRVFTCSYIDTSYSGDSTCAHIGLKYLCKVIEPSARAKVFCMHMSDLFREQIAGEGFSVPEKVGR